MAYEEITPGTWIPENDGDCIEGVFVKSEKDVGPNKAMLYHLQVDEKPLSFWGCTILDQRMTFINPGDKIKVTYKGLGEKKGGQNAPKIFKVEVDRQ